ncbi:MAG: hypothetical protein RLZZ316_1893 [Bacteroidota bacterium]
MRKTYLLPNLVTALPLKGSVSICPKGNANKMLPNAASLNCKLVFISGMRLAQLANDKPWQKKNTATAIRTCTLFNAAGSVDSVVNCKKYGQK